jgi:hypothetical protein
MMTSSYMIGQKHYPVPYPVKKISFYLALAAGLCIFHRWVINSLENPVLNMGLATVLLAVFLYAVQQKEQFNWARAKRT